MKKNKSTLSTNIIQVKNFFLILKLIKIIETVFRLFFSFSLLLGNEISLQFSILTLYHNG